MKKIKNGVDLWKIVDPCPEEFLRSDSGGPRRRVILCHALSIARPDTFGCSTFHGLVASSERLAEMTERAPLKASTGWTA